MASTRVRRLSDGTEWLTLAKAARLLPAALTKPQLAERAGLRLAVGLTQLTPRVISTYLWVARTRLRHIEPKRPSTTRTGNPGNPQAVSQLAHQGKHGWQLAGRASRQLSERCPDIAERARHLPQRLGRRNQGRCQCWALANHRALLQGRRQSSPNLFGQCLLCSSFVEL